MENLNEGKKAKGYMAELAEIDKQSALVALEAKINKLAEMAEAKTNRLSMVHEDENLSELISKQAVKEMQRSIKEIEKLKEKLLKEFTKKGGKMTEVIDEDARTDAEEEGYLDGMKDEKEDIGEGGYDSTYEEDDSVNEDFEDVVDDIMDQGKSREDAEKIAGAINRDHVGRYRQEESLEETNEEFLRMQKLAGVISEEEYKTQVDELFGFGKKKRASSGGGSKGHAVFAYEGGNKRRIGHGLTAKDARRDADWQRYRRNFNVDKFEVVNLDNDQVVDTMKG